MKIWIDISNAPHINLFKNLIKDYQSEGHEVIVTCRPLSNTVSLLNLHNIKYTIIGIHYGKNILKKLFGYSIRVWQLRKFINPLKVDIAVSQSSFHSPVAARLMGIPSIYMNDNEHAMGNIPSFICATKVMVPEFLDIQKVRRQGASLKKVIRYPGVKEGIYLWQNFLSPHISNVTEIKHNKSIFIRPEPRTAQYYKGGLNFLDDIIIALKDHYRVVVLTRDQEQLNHYKTEKFTNLIVPENTFLFQEIALECLLFIGAGGTMTREMAVIGVPTISVYQDELLDVDKYLINEGLMHHLPHLNIETVMKFIKNGITQEPDKKLLRKGNESYNLLKSTIEKTIIC